MAGISHSGLSKSIWDFDPTTIGGCTLWLDGADRNTLFSNAAGTTPSTIGGSVARWNDKSISGNNASQSTTANQPIMSSNGIRFTQSSSHFLSLSTSTLPTGANNATYFTITTRDPNITGASAILAYGTTTDSQGRQIYDRDGNITGAYLVQAVTNNGNNPANTTAVNTIQHLTTITVDKYIGSGWFNGSPFGITNQDLQNTQNVFNTGTTAAYVGRQIVAGASAYYGGTISEILVYNTALSNTDRQTVEGYLAWKWGLQNALPSTHPYYTSTVTPQFIPTIIPNCSLWLDAADLITLYNSDNSTTTPITSSGQTLGRWSDKSGNDNYAYAVGSVKPTVVFNSINSRNSINFAAGSSQFLSLNLANLTTLPNGSQSGTYFTVSRSTATPPTSFEQMIFNYGTIANNPNNTYIRRMYYSTSKTFAFDTTLTNGVTDATSLGNSVAMMSATQTSTLTSGWDNGSPFSGGTVATGTMAVGTQFGAIGAGFDASDLRTYYLIGDVCEIIVYKAELTTLQRQQIEGYLAWKWGIQASLPSTHPYALANYFYTNTRPFSRNFVPTDISNCIMWYDGADMSSMFQDTGGTTPVTGTTQTIALWRDKSGSGNNLTSAAGPTYTATTLNPRRFNVTFNGTSQFMSNTALVNNSNTYTKFLVFQRDTVVLGNYQRLFSYATVKDQLASDPTGFHIQHGTNTNQTSYLLFKSNVFASFSILTGTYYIATIVANPLTMSLFLNGSLTASATVGPLPNTNFGGTTFRLGTNFTPGNNQFWPGFINEVISYNRQLSTYEYQEVEGYLAWKWGLRSSLPTTHPFYRFPTPSVTPIQPELQLYKPQFDPSDLNPDIWFDAQDRSNMAVDSNGRITQWKNKGTATSCSFLSIPSFASRSLNASETNSNALTVSGPLLSTTTSTNAPTLDYLDFSTGSYPITAASLSGTTMTLTLGAPTTVNVTGGSIAAFSLSTLRGSNTTTLATIYFTEQLVPPFSVGSSIVITNTVNSGTALNGTWTVASCTPFYVTFALVGATAGSLTTQGTISSSTLPNFATVNYTTTAAKQPFIAGQTIATISGMTPAGLNGTTPTLLTAGPNQIQFLTSVATGNISSGGTITNAVVPHNIPSGRQIAVGFANGSTFSGGAVSTNAYFLIDTVDKLGAIFTGRGTYYIVNSVPAPNTLTITVPSGLPAGSVNIVAGRVDYGEILMSTGGSNLSGVSAPYQNTTSGVNVVNTLASTGNTSTSATVTFTPSNRFYNQSFVAGDTIIISGVANPTTYNGTWYVTGGSSTSVTFQTTTTLANMVSSNGTLFRAQVTMPSGCYGIQSISVTGTTATVTYNNFGVSINQSPNGYPFKIGHAIYIAGTTATGASPNIFNGTFIVTRDSNDSGSTGTVQFTTTAAAGTTATTGIICRGSGGSAGISGVFPITTFTKDDVAGTVTLTFANQPYVPFVIGQQIMISGSVGQLGDINGIRTVVDSTVSSVTFKQLYPPVYLNVNGNITGGVLNVTSGTYTSPTLTLNFTPSIVDAFPVGTWVAVYGVVPAVNNGYWQVTGGNTSSVQLSVPSGSGPITNTTGTVSYALQISYGSMTQHGLSPGDLVQAPGGIYTHFTSGSNYPGVTTLPYTVISTPSVYRYTVLPRYNYYQTPSNQGFTTTVGPVYSNDGGNSITFFPITGYCLENTRSQSSSGILNSTNASLFYMSHFHMNSQKTAESGTGTLLATSTTVNGNAANAAGSLALQYNFASAPRYNLFRNGQGLKGNGSDSYYQSDTFLGSNLNAFRQGMVVCNLTANTVNDVTPQTVALSLLGTRLETAFRNGANNGQNAIQVSNQTATVVNASWTSNVVTLTLIMNSRNAYVVGDSITVQNVLPTGYNGGPFTVTGSTSGPSSGGLTYTGWTMYTITYALTTNPGTYTAGTGTVLLNTSTSLSTNHIRIGAPTQATNDFSATSFMNMYNYYSQGIGDIIGFNRILTTEERQLLEGWASQKYVAQTYLAQNQASVKSDTTFRVTQASYTGSGPYVNTITFTSTAGNPFAFNTTITISGCTEATALNGTWGVTGGSNTTVTFFSPTILLPSTPLTITSTTNVTGITTANTFIHPYRANPVTIAPSLTLTNTYAQGLAAWFDAANSSTIGFVSSNNINRWTTAGGSFSLTLVPNGTNYPTLVQNAQNGLPGVRFTVTAGTGTPLGTSFNLPITNFSTMSANNEYTIITVYRQPTYSENQVIATVIGSASNPRLMMRTQIFSYRNSTTEQLKNYTATTSGQTYIGVHYRRGNTMLARVNGTQDAGSYTAGTNLNLNLSGLGSIFSVSLGAYAISSPDASAFAGDIYEHVMFRYALTDQSIYQIEGYLAWKWGLQTSLPTTHPYYRVRP